LSSNLNDALRVVKDFRPSPEEQKSWELTVALLELTEAPFSRHQFQPGHITCSALVFAPDGKRVLLMHHHRHQRWLLPGGHVEQEDASLADAARRETEEETGVVTVNGAARLTGMDVHGIPAHKGEPFHLHHDLIWALKAESDTFACTDEAPRIAWCKLEDLNDYAVPANIIRAAQNNAIR
jgi:8-oxo-dGTP pyrophosphatase MutT (NUDIX family)